MKAEIITIGDELLIGQTVDTNSAWMGQQLNAIGIRVNRITSISDERQEIIDSVDTALSRADLVLITGGLGPTNDDITKQTLTDYFGTSLQMRDDIREDIEAFFRSRGREALQVNTDQALLPKDARIVRNYKGTASGMWFERDGKAVISMPGVPYEMKHLMETGFLPMIATHFKTMPVYHQTILTTGQGESHVAKRIEEWENALSQTPVKLAYLPSIGLVKLRLSAFGEDQEALKSLVEEKAAELEDLLADIAFGRNTDTLQDIVGRELLRRGEKLATAESCSGGYIAHLLTSVAGCSAYYEGSLVTYSYQSKSDNLGVPMQLIKDKGAVSGEVVEAMAKGLFERFDVDYAIAVSGIAGPDGGTPDKPVGTVWMAVVSKTESSVVCHHFGRGRKGNIQMTAITALNTLRKMLVSS